MALSRGSGSVLAGGGRLVFRATEDYWSGLASWPPASHRAGHPGRKPRCLSHAGRAHFPGIAWDSQMSPAQCGEGTARGPKRPPATPARYSVFSGEAGNPAFPLETVIFLVAASSGAF